MRIIGIDPGFGRVGWGVIEKVGSDWRAVDYGCIETDPKAKFVERLADLHCRVADLIKKHQPELMAVEELFFFKNVTTAIQVAQARGAILLTAINNGIDVDEFTPLQIKQAMTGYGRADKSQMQELTRLMLGLKEKIKSDDAADALAVAICAGQSLWMKKVKNQ